MPTSFRAKRRGDRGDANQASFYQSIVRELLSRINQIVRELTRYYGAGRIFKPTSSCYTDVGFD